MQPYGEEYYKYTEEEKNKGVTKSRKQENRNAERSRKKSVRSKNKQALKNVMVEDNAKEMFEKILGKRVVNYINSNNTVEFELYDGPYYSQLTMEFYTKNTFQLHHEIVYRLDTKEWSLNNRFVRTSKEGAPTFSEIYVKSFEELKELIAYEKNKLISEGFTAKLNL